MAPHFMQNILDKGRDALHQVGNNDQKPMQGGHADDEHLPNVRFEKGQHTPKWPQPGEGPPGPGQMPPKVANLDYKGKMTFFKPDGHPHGVMRDLGFSGVIDGKVVWCWGDTLMGTQKKSFICANDSTSIGSVANPMHACDTAYKDGHVKQWVPATQQEEHEGGIVRYGYGGTNIIEYAPNKGLMYYLKNDRKNNGQNIIGGGVALVHMEGEVPVAQRVHDTLWGPKEPHYGDVGIAYDSRDKHVYVFGHGPNNGDKELESRTFMCKVPVESATDKSKYSYWDNGDRRWRPRSPRNPAEPQGPKGLQLTQNMAIFDWYNMNQSAPFWSNYFNKWMLLYGDCFGGSPVRCKTADHLEGPWQDHGEIADTKPNPGVPEEKAFRYCHTGHPWVDDSGKTVLVTWTRANWIWGVMITWA